MPLYEYQCEKCGHLFEKIQRVSDPSPECPVCAGPVHKRQSAPAFQFKGSGWYITDYARKDQGEKSGEAKKSDAPAADAKAGETRSAEAKPGEPKAAKEGTAAESKSAKPEKTAST
jgi:putative FmdB family regulatory protein